MTDEMMDLNRWHAEHLFGLIPCQNARCDSGYCYAEPTSPTQGGEPPDVTSWLGVEKLISAMVHRGFGYSVLVAGKDAFDLVSFGIVGGTVYASGNGERIIPSNLPYWTALSAQRALQGEEMA